MEKWSSPNRPQQQCRVLYSTEKKTVNNEKDFEGEASSRNWNHHEIQFCQAQQQKPRATQESRTCDLRRNGGARNFQYLGRGKSNTMQVHVNTQLTTHQIRSEVVIQENEQTSCHCSDYNTAPKELNTTDLWENENKMQEKYIKSMRLTREEKASSCERIAFVLELVAVLS